MIKIGIVGMGYWGPNLYRNFDSSKDFLVKYICDRDLKLIKKIYVIWMNALYMFYSPSKIVR